MTEPHKPLAWIKKNTVFPMSAGKRLAGKPIGRHLLGFQEDFYKKIFSSDGEVQKSTLLYGCRKVGKSLSFSASLWYILNDKARFGEVWPVSASTRDQAQILYNQIESQIVLQKKEDKFILRKDFIQSKKTKTKLIFLGSSGAHNLGLETQGAVLDQIESHRSSENLMALETAGAFSGKGFLRLYSMNPPQPGHFSINLLKNCERKRDLFYVKRYSLPFTRDWTQEDAWIDVNPFLQEWRESKGNRFQMVMDFYRDQFSMAKDSKEYELSFRRMLLGQALSASGIEFIPQNKITFCKDKSIFKYRDFRWSVGFDPSVTHDFTSMCILGYSEGKDECVVVPFLYLPNVTNRTPSQQKMFREWADCGYISLQDRDVLDPQEPIDDFYHFVHKYRLPLEAVTFDKALSGFYLDSFKNNFKTETIQMTPRAMTPAIRRLERCGNSERGLTVYGNENPAVRWMFDNILISQKSKNYCLLNRASDDLNIDFPVACSLAMHYLVHNKKKRFLVGSF